MRIVDSKTCNINVGSKMAMIQNQNKEDATLEDKRFSLKKRIMI